MNNPTRGTDEDPAIEAGLRRIAREIELMGLLEAVALRASELFGATQLIVERSENLESADIKAVIGETDLVDLWDLDPMLWDDANWAAVRFVPVGEVTIVRPRRRY